MHGDFDNQYKYFAFISYSRKNRLAAKRIQRYLENYVLPSNIAKNYPSVPRRIKPVFRDVTDINTGELTSVLQKNLTLSKYLIIICSPDSGKSFYVNEEIKYFCSLGREKNIIPLIIKGKPDDENASCYPPALNKKIIGANIREGGYQKALVRVIGTMLGIDHDIIWQRERRRIIKRRIGIGVSLALAIAGISYYILCYLPEVNFLLEDHVGDVVSFGNYEQDNTSLNGEEPIEWRILEQYEDGTFLLLSEKCLDVVPYNETCTDMTWEDCSLRGWLNSEFYEEAFSAEEQKKIVYSEVENDIYNKYGISGGNNTQDYVYILSINEAQKYYGENWVNLDGCFGTDELICDPTEYAVGKNATQPDPYELDVAAAEIFDYDYKLSDEAVQWWLRSPGNETDKTAYVDWYGEIITYPFEIDMDNKNTCVRPVIKARLTQKDFDNKVGQE